MSTEKYLEDKRLLEEAKKAKARIEGALKAIENEAGASIVQLKVAARKLKEDFDRATNEYLTERARVMEKWNEKLNKLLEEY